MRKIVAISVALFLLVSCLHVYADDDTGPVSLYVNGVLQPDAVPPKIVKQEAYLAADTLAVLLDARLSRNPDSGQTVIRNEALELTVQASESTARVNGDLVDLGAAVFEEQGVLYVPVRTLGKTLGMKTIADPLTRSVFLYRQGSVIRNPHEQLNDIAERQKEVLAPSSPPAASVPGGAVRVNGGEITIVSDNPAVPRTLELLESPPYRLVFDYPASAFGPVNGSKSFSGELKGDGISVVKVRYALNDPQTLRFVVELPRPASYRLTQSDGGKVTLISINQSAGKSRYKIVIDPGHGGKDPGATGASGRDEKHFTLELSLKIYELMRREPALEPYLTRTDDSYPTLEERAAFANDLDADLYISIHGNTFKGVMKGTETYYFGDYSKAFAMMMHEHVVKAAQTSDRKVRQADFMVLRLTKMPSVLLEIGYLSDPAEEKRMLSEEFQDKVAAAIVAGVKQYLNLTN